MSTDLSNIIAHGGDGTLYYYNIDDRKPVGLADSTQAVPEGVAITQLRFLNGSKSWIVGGSDGSLTQWMLTRQEDNTFKLTGGKLSRTQRLAPLPSWSALNRV